MAGLERRRRQATTFRGVSGKGAPRRQRSSPSAKATFNEGASARGAARAATAVCLGALSVSSGNQGRDTRGRGRVSACLDRHRASGACRQVNFTQCLSQRESACGSPGAGSENPTRDGGSAQDTRHREGAQCERDDRGRARLHHQEKRCLSKGIDTVSRRGQAQDFAPGGGRLGLRARAPNGWKILGFANLRIGG